MDITGICGMGIITAILAFILREFKKEYAVLVACTGGLFILVWSISTLTPILEYIDVITGISGASPYFAVMGKALGIGFLTQIGADLCRDTGEASLAGKVEFAGKVAILTVCLPVLKAIFDMSLQILG